jgi:hypothetical protein
MLSSANVAAATSIISGVSQAAVTGKKPLYTVTPDRLTDACATSIGASAVYSGTRTLVGQVSRLSVGNAVDANSLMSSEIVRLSAALNTILSGSQQEMNAVQLPQLVVVGTPTPGN